MEFVKKFEEAQVKKNKGKMFKSQGI